MKTRLALTVAAAILTAAAARPAAAQNDSRSVSAADSARPRAARHHRDLITAEEIAEHPAANAYTLVYSLHPEWLRIRGTENFYGRHAQLVVYRDGTMAGGAEALRSIPPEAIGEIRFLDGNEAVMRFGKEYGGGAILVSSR